MAGKALVGAVCALLVTLSMAFTVDDSLTVDLTEGLTRRAVPKRKCLAPSFISSMLETSFLEENVELVTASNFMDKLLQGQLPSNEDIVTEAQKVSTGMVIGAPDPAITQAKDNLNKFLDDFARKRNGGKPLPKSTDRIDLEREAKYALKPWKFCIAPTNKNRNVIQWCNLAFSRNPVRTLECKNNFCVACCDTAADTLINTARTGERSIISSLGFDGPDAETVIRSVMNAAETDVCRAACFDEYPADMPRIENPPNKDPTLGLTPDFPGKSCADIRKWANQRNDGVYFIKVGTRPSQAVYCDMITDGGGWTLFYAYRHKAGEQYELNPQALPKDPRNSRSHMNLQEAGFAVADVQELRFWCKTMNSEKPAVIHFKTKNDKILMIAMTGNQKQAKPNDWAQAYQELPAPPDTDMPDTLEQAYLPKATDDNTQDENGGFWNSPFSKRGENYWTIKGDDNRWECDDYLPSGGKAFETLHNIWFRGEPATDDFQRQRAADKLKKKPEASKSANTPPPVTVVPKKASGSSFLEIQATPSASASPSLYASDHEVSAAELQPCSVEALHSGML